MLSLFDLTEAGFPCINTSLNHEHQCFSHFSFFFFFNYFLSIPFASSTLNVRTFPAQSVQHYSYRCIMFINLLKIKSKKLTCRASTKDCLAALMHRANLWASKDKLRDQLLGASLRRKIFVSGCYINVKFYICKRS